MLFADAIKALKNGKKVRRRCWQPEDFVYLKHNEICNKTGMKVRLCNILTLDADDWDILIEPVYGFDEADRMVEVNPANFCINCDKYIGFKGFCSTKCHDEFYDTSFPTKDFCLADCLETIEVSPDGNFHTIKGERNKFPFGVFGDYVNGDNVKKFVDAILRDAPQTVKKDYGYFHEGWHEAIREYKKKIIEIAGSAFR